MRNIIFEVTDNEYKVLLNQCADPEEWVENAVNALIERAKDLLVENEITRILEDSEESVLINDRSEIIARYQGPLKGDPTL